VRAAGESPGHLGELQLGFAFGGKSGVELLPTLKTVFQGALTLGAALETTFLHPVTFATGRAALQRLQTEVHGELPGGALLYVTPHDFHCLQTPSSWARGVHPQGQPITALSGVESKYASEVSPER
jgi:hypothetical protein